MNHSTWILPAVAALFLAAAIPAQADDLEVVVVNKRSQVWNFCFPAAAGEDPTDGNAYAARISSANVATQYPLITAGKIIAVPAGATAVFKWKKASASNPSHTFTLTDILPAGSTRTKTYTCQFTLNGEGVTWDGRPYSEGRLMDQDPFFLTKNFSITTSGSSGKKNLVTILVDNYNPAPPSAGRTRGSAVTAPPQ